ncbi:hypothetical protein LCGC14_1915790 [marine sediment metagenome]|uniref:Exonuclease domain-containing protein n=1 Tax=marine sediment metagenome TaxID=412755 RepID=A0A0F9I6A3_9ZZZZ
MRDFDIISLDLETSGTDEEETTILSIGCVRLSDLQPFYADIRHKSLTVVPEAMRVNGIDITKVDGPTRQPLSKVDEAVRAWLRSDEFYQEGKTYTLVPMGMNVGTFDMEFVREHLPKSAALFGYRSMDLNSMIFAEAVRTNVPFKHVKRAAKMIGTSYAHAHVPNLGPHHALWDAYSNIGVFHYLEDAKANTVGEVVWEGGKPSNV